MLDALLQPGGGKLCSLWRGEIAASSPGSLLIGLTHRPESTIYRALLRAPIISGGDANFCFHNSLYRAPDLAAEKESVQVSI